MNAATCSDRGLLLAAVAVLGLVVTPVLHAEEHSREQREDETEAAALLDAWRAASGDPLDALASALEHVHESQQQKPAGKHQRSEHHSHSHGPAGSEPHGSNVLAHLGIALHSAPQLPSMAVVPQDHAPPASVTAQLRGTLRYLVPECSQGPPVDC